MICNRTYHCHHILQFIPDHVLLHLSLPQTPRRSQCHPKEGTSLIKASSQGTFLISTRQGKKTIFHRISNNTYLIHLSSNHTHIHLQEVKKAKQFETRKIARRLKQAIQDENELSVVQKLEAQLVAAKAIDLDAITKKAMKPVEEIAGTQQPTNSADLDDADPVSNNNSDTVIANRILAAACVQKAVDQAKAGIAQVLKAMRGSDSEQEQQMEGSPAGHNNNNKTKEEEEAPSSEHTLPSSSSEGEGAPSEIDSEAEEALSKLLKVRQPHGVGDDSENEEEDNESDSDSGLVNLDEDDKQWLTEEGLLQVLSSGESSELSDEDRGGFNSEEEGGDGDDKKMVMKKGLEDGKKGVEKKGGKQQPKKKRNRLGQRARRRLVEAAAGRLQYTNRAPYNDNRQSGRWNETAFKSRSHAHDSRRPAATRKRVVPEKEEDLHPSWAAKKKKLPLIAPAAGKKIKFDD